MRPVRTQTGTESLHETGMKVTSDYMRPVWTQTGTIIQRLLCACLTKISDRSEISLRLHGKNCRTGLTSSRHESNRSEVIFRTGLKTWRPTDLKSYRSEFVPVSCNHLLRRCLHDTSTSFIPVRNLFSYRLYVEVILPEWYEVSREPSFSQASLERCWLSTGIRYPSQSTQPLISYRNETSYLLYMIPVQNVVRFHTGQDECFLPVREPEWTRTVWLVPVQHFVPVSCKHPLSCLSRVMVGGQY